MLWQAPSSRMAKSEQINVKCVKHAIAAHDGSPVFQGVTSVRIENEEATNLFAVQVGLTCRHQLQDAA